MMRHIVIGVAAAALLVVAAGCRKKADVGDAPLSRRALPGFSLELPSGTVKEQRLDYGTGKYELHLDGNRGGVAIEWHLGEPLTDDELEQMAVQPLRELLGLQQPVRRAVEVAGAQGGTQFILRGGKKKIDMRLTAFTCGKRWFTLLVASGASAETLDERIRQSFRCTPDAAEEVAARPIPVVATLGPEIGVVEDAADQLLLESLDGEGVVFARTTAAFDGDLGKQAAVAKLLEAIAQGSGIAGLSVGVAVKERRGESERPIWRGAGTLEGQPVRVLMTLFACGDDRLAGLYIGDQALPESRGLDLLVPAACAPPGTPPPRPPTFAEMAAAACTAGDRRGCAEPVAE
jgi:hypothetical protein